MSLLLPIQCLVSMGLLHGQAGAQPFDPDPGTPPVRPRPASREPAQRRVVTETSRADPSFNPDPGMPPILQTAPIRAPFGLPQRTAFTNVPSLGAQRVRGVEWIDSSPPVRPPEEPLSPPEGPLSLNRAAHHGFAVPAYPLSAAGQTPPHTEPRTNRWRIAPEPWKRYTAGQAETPYQSVGPDLWHPYRQSLLKGDVPILGQDVFLNLSASLQSELEVRRLQPGDSDELLSQNYLGFSAELYQGETVFRPARWRFFLRPVASVSHFESDPLARTESFFALQEAYGEAALAVLSDNYDLAAARLGSQSFNSDFRGFIFNDVNSGLRVFGNAGNNRWQYNLAIFDMREKETFSELNSFDERGQRVVAANLYRQDALWSGYTAQFSLHANFDEGSEHRSQTGAQARPAPLPGAREHDLRAFYLGWAGDGRIGRVNISHAFYQALGRDDFNALAGAGATINAQMAALELSIDQDWMRYKGSLFYASGDSDPADNSAQGFDAILESPHFAGSPFSTYARQGFGLGSGLNLKGRNTLIPSMRASKLEGQASFVNPGVFLAGFGAEARLTQKLRAFAHANYVRLAAPEPVEQVLSRGDIDPEIGYDLSAGVQYRPFLVNNVIVQAGFGVLLPGAGYRDLYPDSNLSCSGLITLALTY